MLRTNPTAPTKAPAASGAHASIKAPRPGRRPPRPSPAASALGASSALVPLPLRRQRCQREGGEERGAKKDIETPSGGLAGLSLPRPTPAAAAPLPPEPPRVRPWDGGGPAGALGRMEARL